VAAEPDSLLIGLGDVRVTVSDSDDQLRLIRPPRLRTVGGERGRRATYLELFFDLVFVVAIAQLAHELVLDHSLGGFGVFGALFLPVYLAWQGFTFYADRFDTDDLVFRLVMLTAMVAIAALAIQIPEVAHGDSAEFVVPYVVLRSLVVGLYVRSYRHVPQARPLIVRYAAGYSFGITLWLASLAFTGPGRYVVWAVAIACEYSVPGAAGRRAYEAAPVDLRHVPERLALFTLIVLGETLVVVALGTSEAEWELAAAAVAVLGFVCAGAVWWIYFGTGEERTMKPSVNAVFAFTHVHIPLLAALTALSAGVSLVIERASAGGLDTGTRWALAGGAALFLVCITVCQRVTVQGVLPGTLWTQTVGAAALVALARVGGSLERIAFVALAAGVLVAVVAVKLWLAYSLAGVAEEATRRASLEGVAHRHRVR
jgi:low temperature requirement protein LtrA